MNADIGLFGIFKRGQCQTTIGQAGTYAQPFAVLANEIAIAFFRLQIDKWRIPVPRLGQPGPIDPGGP
ncbi:MAG: hypothetical protein GDA36_03235 [Rhodobacteraceae bacterium]|nr:hypothetical protein [Paracoccaceae bacterium]